MNIHVLCGPNNGAIYIDGAHEISHDSLQRGCGIEEVSKALGMEKWYLLEEVEGDNGELKFWDVEVGAEPYLGDHGCFPLNSKLLVGRYW